MFRRLSLLPGSLRAKFIAAFACMSVLPFLVCFYIITVYVMPFAESVWLTSVTVLLTMLICFCGFYIMEQIVASIIKLSEEARRLAKPASPPSGAVDESNEIVTIKEALKALAEDVERARTRVRELETIDRSVGVYTEAYIRLTLAEELKRSKFYQRPCSMLMARFGNNPATEKILAAEGNRNLALSCLASFMQRFTGEIGKIGRCGRDKLCLILPEHNRRQALDVSERIKAESESIYWDALSSLLDWAPELSFTIASAPVDGTEVADLFDRCLSARPRAGL